MFSLLFVVVVRILIDLAAFFGLVSQPISTENWLDSMLYVYVS